MTRIKTKSVSPPVALFNVGSDTSLGAITGANFQPQYILFYRLKVLRNGAAAPDDGWTYQFTACGRYNSTDIAQFVEMVRSDDLPTLASTDDSPLEPPSITVTDPCYVVVELTSDDPTMRFRDNHEAIKTSDDHRTQYRRLAHVDVDGNIHFGTATTHCNLVYFAVKSVALTDEDHRYNIYVQYGVNGTPQTIDPAIKNRGGDDDLLAKAAAPRYAGNAAAKLRAPLRTRKSPKTLPGMPSGANGSAPAAPHVA